jgi:hypothetical protein
MPIIDAAMRQLNRQRLDAQPLPHDRGVLSGEGSDLRLATGVRAAFMAAAGGWRSGSQQRRLAVECQQRHGSKAAAHLQSREPGRPSSIRTATYIRHWLPELAHVTHGGFDPRRHRRRLSDAATRRRWSSHKRQQAHFKALHAASAAGVSSGG